MDTHLLVISTINLIVIIVFILFEIRFLKSDLLSPAPLVLFFLALSGVSLVYYSFNLDLIINYFPTGSSYTFDIVYLVYLYHLFTSVFVYALIAGLLRSGVFKNKAGVIGELTNSKFLNTPGTSYFFPVIFFLISIGLIFLLLAQVGGVGYLWANMGLRQDILAGSGYLMRFSVISLQLSAIVLYLSLSRTRLIKYLPILIAVGVLALLGARLPIFGFIFIAVLVHHYLVKKLEVRLSYVFIGIICIYSALMLGEVRSTQYETSGSKSEFFASVNNSAFDHLRLYTINLRRDIAVFDYFSRNEHWYGATYSSLFYAPVPSSIYPDKPPVDTGRYITTLAAGERVEPPMPIHKLRNYGWPPGLLEGYANFSFPGIILLATISILLLIFSYQVMITSTNVITIFVFGTFIFRGVPYLDILNIVSIITLLVILFMLSFTLRVIGGLSRRL